MTLRNLLFIFPILLSCGSSIAQTDSLRKRIEEQIEGKNAAIGVAIMGFDDNETFFFNKEAHYPMQSVYKFHLALAVLNQVDKGSLSLEQKVHLTPKNLLPDTWSPLRDTYAEGNVDVSIRELLSYSVSQSDNNACDILFHLAGGTGKVNDYIRSLGITGMDIAATEEEMHKNWEAQYTNWSTPEAMLTLLEMFYRKQLLSESSHDLLWQIMTETSTGATRIRGLLPENAIVAHKTGTSGTNEEGITGAVNDAGIVVLPNGKHLAIAVFVSNSKEDDETNEKVIAGIAKAAWDYFSANSN